MIHEYDLAALDLLPPPAPPHVPPRPVSVALLPAFAACDLADAAVAGGIVLARAWLCAGWLRLDAAERAGARR